MDYTLAGMKLHVILGMNEIHLFKIRRGNVEFEGNLPGYKLGNISSEILSGSMVVLIF